MHLEMIGDKIFTVPFIRGVAVTLPKDRIVLKDLAAEMKVSNTSVKNIIKVSGIHEVRKSAEDKTISDYCINAAEHLIDTLEFDKSQIDGIVFVTPLHDHIFPGSGFIVHDRMNLRSDCFVINLNHACTGYVDGLFQAYMLIQSGYCKNVLLCCGDTPLKKINLRDKSLRMVQGDAGTATIISAGDDNKSGFSFYVDSKGFKSLYIPAGGTRIPLQSGVTDIDEADDYGNVRNLSNLQMNGLDVMTFAVHAVPITIDKTLNLIDWQKDEVDSFVFHQANVFIVDSLRKHLHIPVEKVPIHVENYGNVGCGTIPLALCIENNPNRKALDKVILCGFGAGLSCSSVALSLKDTYFCKPIDF